MAECDRFQEFRSGVPAATEDARRQAAARLRSAMEGKDGRGREPDSQSAGGPDGLCLPSPRLPQRLVPRSSSAPRGRTRLRSSSERRQPHTTRRDHPDLKWESRSTSATRRARSPPRSQIRIDPASDCPIPGCADEPSYAYVDTETFYPVETRGLGGIVPARGPVVPLQMVIRFITVEYLPRTAATVALANIEAQHPDATR